MRKAFTLVELIVVITILGILGTIAFISLQGYSAQARDSKRLTNINDLTRKINIEIVRGADPEDMMEEAEANMNGVIPKAKTDYGTTIAGLSTNDAANAALGIVDFNAIRESRENFQDPIRTVTKDSKEVPQDYPFAFAYGGTGEDTYNFLQMASIIEAENVSRVVGNFFQIKIDSAETTAKSLILIDGKYAVDGKGAVDADSTVLPY